MFEIVKKEKEMKEPLLLTVQEAFVSDYDAFIVDTEEDAWYLKTESQDGFVRMGNIVEYYQEDDFEMHLSDIMLTPVNLEIEVTEKE